MSLFSDDFNKRVEEMKRDFNRSTIIAISCFVSVFVLVVCCMCGFAAYRRKQNHMMSMGSQQAEATPIQLHPPPESRGFCNQPPQTSMPPPPQPQISMPQYPGWNPDVVLNTSTNASTPQLHNLPYGLPPHRSPSHPQALTPQYPGWNPNVVNTTITASAPQLYNVPDAPYPL